MHPKARIAVITPYYKESLSILEQCHKSVLAQHVHAIVDHFMIADGYPKAEIAKWNVKHVCLPNAHSDNGNTPRGIGSALADAENYDFVAYLDADNWYYPDHLASLLALHQQSQSPVCCSMRTFHKLDGSPLNISEPQEDSLLHVDTSCFLIHSSAFDLLRVWYRMPKQLGPICDRVFKLTFVNSRFSIAYSKKRTVAFRSQYRLHYELAGQPITDELKFNAELEACYEYLVTQEGVSKSIERIGFWPLREGL
jgi:glycosyltransferase involved in cell wall biosynthesis